MIQSHLVDYGEPAQKVREWIQSILQTLAISELDSITASPGTRSNEFSATQLWKIMAEEFRKMSVWTPQNSRELRDKSPDVATMIEMCTHRLSDVGALDGNQSTNIPYIDPGLRDRDDFVNWFARTMGEVKQHDPDSMNDTLEPSIFNIVFLS